MESYEKMLELAYKKVKTIESRGGRFEVQPVEGFFQGKKTIITNLNQIATHVRRDPDHILKFLTKELATKGQFEGDKVVLNNKIPSKKINPKVENYVEEFVLCKECGKPDTELSKEGKITKIHCLACGAKHPIRTKI